MHDLPTDWLPRSTILSLNLPETVLAELFINDIYIIDNMDV
jgi:hypothetical protein